VTPVLVTRGDVPLDQILATLPYAPAVIWDNSTRPYDAGVFGRYLALAEVTTPVAFVQDDDCIVRCHDELLAAYEPGMVVGNAFDDPVRLAKYHDTTLLGWGALFDTDLPWAAFRAYARFHPFDWEFMTGLGAEVTFPMLTPSRTITHGVEWLDEDGPVLERPNRMWKAPGFYERLDAALGRAREVRDMLTLEGVA
jgi:hypothetical protein